MSCGVFLSVLYNLSRYLIDFRTPYVIHLVLFMFMFSKFDGSHSCIFVYNVVYFLIHNVIILIYICGG